jgi:hypothetical protein
MEQFSLEQLILQVTAHFHHVFQGLQHAIIFFTLKVEEFRLIPQSGAVGQVAILMTEYVRIFGALQILDDPPF